jgi:predicted dehydrogenase
MGAFGRLVVPAAEQRAIPGAEAMHMAYRMIQVGTGGFGGAWCASFLPPNVRDGLIEVVAAVDINPDALANAREHLGLPDAKLYTDVRRAFDENPADFCTIVVPPAHHEAVVDEALAHGLHILSEKPIADTLEASVRIADKVRRAGRKMGVTMSHRFDQDKTTLRTELRSGRHGALDYLVCRFTCDCRKFASWGKFRHEIPDALMVEGAVHHLDILADLAGARCETIYAQTWNPPWGEFAGHSQGLVIMGMENGVRATYEGAKTNAVGLNGWAQEYIRAECELATLVLSRWRLERFPYDPSGSWAGATEGQGEEMPLLQQPKWANAWLIEQFVRWLDGGPAMETNVEDNLQSVALVFAAIESSRTGRAVKVQDFLAAARRDLGGAAHTP